MATAAEISNFIELLGGLAVAESNRRIAAGQGFILPSVCIAQSALETGWGTSGLMTRANAFFGIKAGGSWTGSVYSASTWEVANGVEYNTTANFRAYGSLEESVADYYDLITSLSRYANAVSYGSDSTKWLTARETITAIHAGGYATDTLYVQKIMNTIDARGLTDYDALITGAGGAATPQKGITRTKSDFTQGLTKFNGTEWTTSVDTKTISTSDDKLITIENTAKYAFYGFPVGAYPYIYLYDGSAHALVSVKEGVPGELIKGQTFSIVLSFDSATLIENVTDFTITIAPYVPVNNNDILAYFVKIA